MKDQSSEQMYEEEHTSRLVAMGQMAASLAHEIRNPLGSMELYCSVLKREVRDDQSKLELVSHIQQGISSLSHIVSNCLLFTKDISVNRKEFKTAEMFLTETCRYVSSSYELLDIVMDAPDASASSGLYLSWKELGDRPFMMDPYVLGQILLNLVINALDSCVEKSATHTLSQVEVILDHSEDDTWQLRVKDTGMGMSEEVRNRIYDPFFTTKEKGTGLGLAIVLSLVKAHEANIEINSEESVGTEVTITFYN
jgi:signal transduction histidine kinase